MDVFHHPRGTRGTILIFPRARPAKTPAERTIEPTRGAPGRGVVHPMSADKHRCFRGSDVPRALSPTSTWYQGETRLDPRKHLCRFSSGRRRLLHLARTHTHLRTTRTLTTQFNTLHTAHTPSHYLYVRDALLHRSPTWSYYNLPRLANKRRVSLSSTDHPATPPSPS